MRHRPNLMAVAVVAELRLLAQMVWLQRAVVMVEQVRHPQSQGPALPTLAAVVAEPSTATRPELEERAAVATAR